ncbi:MAG: hypothetical protein WB615_15760 [Candidatus Tumulicola sp.]
MRPAFRLVGKPLPVLFAAAVVSFLLGACESKPAAAPPNVVVSTRMPRAFPTPRVMPPDAPPLMIRIWMSTLTLQPGIWFDGTIVGGTNVASVEVRTAAFSINAAHVAPGVFAFHTRVLELPPLSRRHVYDLSIIARNTAGEQQVEQATLAVQ